MSNDQTKYFLKYKLLNLSWITLRQMRQEKKVFFYVAPIYLFPKDIFREGVGKVRPAKSGPPKSIAQPLK